ncbi:MAG: hypothetical protein MET45_02950 [Nostoc sp. LLA-1]|nr:hypothetical protein [Cyanocohniella sp. LLY]
MSDFINPPKFDMIIANIYGAENWSLPHLITFKKAEITEKGQKCSTT